MKKAKKYIITAIIFTATFLNSNIYAQDQEDIFSENFINAIASEDIDELVKLKPHADFWRIVLEKETQDMTDDEINLKANKNEKLILDFNNIMYSAKNENIDLKKIELKKVKVQKIWENENMPVEMIIKYLYNDKEGNFTLSVFKYEGNYYLSEIRESFNIFNKLK